MSILAKRILSLALIGSLCMHISFVLIYASPLKLWFPKINFISTYYNSPFLYQNWSLFVPVPRSVQNLYVRHQTKMGWSDWEDILNKEIMKHKKNRIYGNENVVLLLSNALHYAFNALPSISSVYIEKQKSKEFLVLRHEVAQYLKLKEAVAVNTSYEVLITSTKENHTVSHYFKSLVIY